MPVSTFRIEILDMVSPGLRTMGGISRAEFGIVRSEIMLTSDEFKGLGEGIKQVGEKMATLKESAAGMFIGGLAERGAERLFEGVKEQIAEVFGGGMEEGMVKMKMKVMAGDIDGAELFEQLKDYIGHSTFGSEVNDVATQMLAMGIKAKELPGIMKELGDISMGDTMHMENLALAFGHVASEGHLQGRELMEMSKDGFNPLAEISRTTGVSMAVLTKEMVKGGITLAMVEGALKSATYEGGKFNGMMGEIMDTAGGMWKEMSTDIENTKKEFGESFSPFLKDFFKDLMPTVEALPQTLEGLRPTIEGIITDMGWVAKHATGILSTAKEIGIAYIAWKAYSLAVRGEEFLIGLGMEKEAVTASGVATEIGLQNEGLVTQVGLVKDLEIQYELLLGDIARMGMAEREGMDAYILKEKEALGLRAGMGIGAAEAEAGAVAGGVTGFGAAALGLASDAIIVVGIAWVADSIIEQFHPKRLSDDKVSQIANHIYTPEERGLVNPFSPGDMGISLPTPWGSAKTDKDVFPKDKKGNSMVPTGTAEAITGGGRQNIHISFRNMVEHFTVENHGGDLDTNGHKTEEWFIEMTRRLWQVIPS